MLKLIRYFDLTPNDELEQRSKDRANEIMARLISKDRAANGGDAQ